MRRKSARNASKVVGQPETPPKKPRRVSKRRKQSVTESSDEDSEDNVPLKLVASQSEETAKSHSPSDGENPSPEEAVWTVTNATKNPSGEIQKLKICLTRPSPEKSDRRRRNRSGTEEEDEEKKVNEDSSEQWPKGKSKSKSKSKSDRSNAQIRRNAQVAIQSPPPHSVLEETDSNVVRDRDDSCGDVRETEETVVVPESTNEYDEQSQSDVMISEEQSNVINRQSGANEIHDKENDAISADDMHSNILPEKKDLDETTTDNKQTESPIEEYREREEINVTESRQIVEIPQKEDDSNQAEVITDENSQSILQEVDSSQIVEEETMINEENLQSETNNDVTVDTNQSIINNNVEVEEPAAEIHESPEAMEVDDETYKQSAQEVSVEESKQEEPVIEKPKETEIVEDTELTRIVFAKKTSDTLANKRTSKWLSKFLELEPILFNITTDLFAKLKPELSLSEESEVLMEIDVKERQRRYELKVSNTDERTENDKAEPENDEPEPETDNTNIIAMNRKISIVDDTASKLKPPPSPAKNPGSEVLFITNLVRPFTLKQLKELLERTGRIKENGFWTDRIKSKCYAHYETIEEAESTRNALHGVHWPIGNGKKLVIEFASVEDMEQAKNPPTPVVIQTKADNEENVEPQKQVEEVQVVQEVEKQKNDAYVREWDVGKYGVEKTYSRDYEGREKHRRRRTPSPDHIARKQRKKEEDVPQKLMDDLFNKTTSTPSIYWLPLTPEEITMKQQQRLLRMAEHKRRLEETTRGGRGGAPFRRRYD